MTTTPPNDTSEDADLLGRLSALPFDLRVFVLEQGSRASAAPILKVAEECHTLRLEVAILRCALAAAPSRPAHDPTHQPPPSVAGPASPLPTKEGTPGDGGKGPGVDPRVDPCPDASTIAGLTQRVELLDAKVSQVLAVLSAMQEAREAPPSSGGYVSGQAVEAFLFGRWRRARYLARDRESGRLLVEEGGLTFHRDPDLVRLPGGPDAS